MTNTIFRDLLGIQIRGERATWPVFLGELFDHGFKREIDIAGGYDADVFIDRMDPRYEHYEGREERKVAQLYDHCRVENQGCLDIGTEKILLLGYHWPNQGNHTHRCADLVGMNKDGALVVFEAKMASATNPMSAILQGLDYLACLLRKENFEQIIHGYEAWKDKHAEILHNSFSGVCPKRGEKPTLIVLAPREYFATESRSTQGKEWLDLAKAADWIPSVNLLFATTDFKSSHAHVIDRAPTSD